MKPYPLAGLNHFTVPVGIVVSVAVSTCRAGGAAASTISGWGGARPERRERGATRGSSGPTNCRASIMPGWAKSHNAISRRPAGAGRGRGAPPAPWPAPAAPPGGSLSRAARCALLCAGGLVLAAAAAEMAAAERRQASAGLIAGGVLLLALLAFEEATGALLTRLLRGLDGAGLETATKGAPLARGARLLALFAWPVLVA